jgi:phosphoglycerate dehydrogenase-like enzyme
VLIATWLEPEYVAEIRKMPGVDVVYEPDLLPKPRYKCDHTSLAPKRDEAGERRWRALLADAEIHFDFDHTNLGELKNLIPSTKWIQGTSAGIGQLLVRTGLIDLPITYTTASGVHATALSEFALMSMLWAAKDAFHMLREQQAKHWARTCARDLPGRTVGIVGLGKIGREIARKSRALGMRTIGTRRTVRPGDADPDVDLLVAQNDLGPLLRAADFLVLCCPLTKETEGLIGAAELAMLPRGAWFINVARGPVVDEQALIANLRSGHLSGAFLDVFQTEPLPADNPLWEMPNVLVSPHSASTVERENERLTELFCDNIGRYLRGEPLRNVFDRKRMY